MSEKISVSLYQTHISNHIFLRELSKHKLRLNGLIVRLLELWRNDQKRCKSFFREQSLKFQESFLLHQIMFVTICLYCLYVKFIANSEHYVIHTKYQLKIAQ